MTQTITYHKADEALPLHHLIVNAFQAFALVIYGPDMYFGYQIYTKGGALISTNVVVAIPEMLLFAALSAGTVGMAYFLSVLAPHHWRKDHKVTAIMCGIGVLIATSVTVLFSLAYRSENPVTYAFDSTIRSWIPAIATWNVSPIQMIAAIAPPFWGLFWAFTQPTETKKSLAEQQLSHEQQMQKLKQDAEMKQLQMLLNTQKRQDALKGWAATAKSAREQVQVALQKDAEDPATGQVTQPVAPTPLAVMTRVQDPNATGAFSPESFDDPFTFTDPDESYAQSGVAAGAENFNPGASIQRLSERRPRQDRYNQSQVQPMPRSRNGGGRNGAGRTGTGR